METKKAVAAAAAFLLAPLALFGEAEKRQGGETAEAKAGGAAGGGAAAEAGAKAGGAEKQPQGDERVKSDTELWNEGVDFYRAGDVTNALERMKGLILSRTHGARAAEVVAKLQHDAAHAPGAKDALAKLEEAASAAQIALRSAPDDPRTNANFSRATDGLRELRKTERINAILKAAEGKDPGGMLGEAARESRKLLAALAANETNAPAAAVAAADSISARIAKLSETWYPVKETICSAVTNREQAATISERVDKAREQTEKAARLAGDLDKDAKYPLAEAEQEFTEFYKMTAMPPAAIREDLVCQSNAWQDAAAEYGRQWQSEALDWTRSFRAKFPAWAQAYSQQAAADTNKPPFTAEAQAQISALATRVEQLQLECAKEAVPPKQEEALAAIRKIIELLPPEQNQGKGQGGGNSQNNDKNKNQNQDKDKQQQDQQNQQDQQDQQQDEQEKDEEGEDDKQAGEQDKQERDIEALLRKAQERNDEHEAEKRARARRVKLPPNAKDW